MAGGDAAAPPVIESGSRPHLTPAHTAVFPRHHAMVPVVTMTNPVAMTRLAVTEHIVVLPGVGLLWM